MVDTITSLDDVEAPIRSPQGAWPALRVQAHPIHFGIGNSRTIIGLAILCMGKIGSINGL